MSTTSSEGRLSLILDDMPLPNHVRKVLQDSIYSVPEDGLFTCTSVGSLLSNACRRDDVVDMLVRRARNLKHAVVALVHGLRRTGKTFSMPWAQLEAIRILEREAAGVHPSPSTSEGVTDSCRESCRRRNVMVVQCHQVRPMDLDEIPVLLAAVVSCIVCDCVQSTHNSFVCHRRICRFRQYSMSFPDGQTCLQLLRDSLRGDCTGNPT